MGPLLLPLTPAPDGPQAGDGGEPWLKSLCWLLRVAAEEDGEVVRAIEGGGSWDHSIMQVRSVDPATDDLTEAAAAWRRLTGSDLDGELVVMYAGGFDQTVVPRTAFLAAARELTRLRRELAIEPPWLFCEAPRWTYAHGSERARVLERTAREAGLESMAAAIPKLRTLMGWRLDAHAMAYARRLEEEAGFLGAPWLFTPKPRYSLPHPAERPALLELEREAADIDAVEAALEGREEPDALLARRARLLRGLGRAGLLTDTDRTLKLRYLDAWSAGTICKLYRAALDALAYLSSDARRRYNPAAEPTDLLDAPVCLDLFRGLVPPPGVPTEDWISWGEYLMRTHGPGLDVQAAQGVFPYHDSDGLIMVAWRRDARRPALRYLSLVR